MNKFTQLLKQLEGKTVQEVQIPQEEEGNSIILHTTDGFSLQISLDYEDIDFIATDISL